MWHCFELYAFVNVIAHILCNPNYDWQEGNHVMYTSANRSVLTLKNLLPDHEGGYVCQLSNSAATINTTFHILLG